MCASDGCEGAEFVLERSEAICVRAEGMIDRLTHHALHFGMNSAAKIDPVKPWFEAF